jgi:hypothetical protein
LIFIGKGSHWLLGKPNKKHAAAGIFATAVVAALLMNLRITFPEMELAHDKRQRETRHLSIGDGTTRSWNVIDMVGVRGGFNDLYMKPNHVMVDGRPLRFITDYHFIPSELGVRLQFVRRTIGDRVEISFEKGVDVGPSSGTSLFGEYRFSLACALRRCPPLVRLPVGRTGEVAVDLSKNGYGQLLVQEGWESPSGNGRPISGRRATMTFAVDARADTSLSLKLHRSTASTDGGTLVSILINDCSTTSTAMTGREQDQVVSIIVPAKCISSSGTIALVINADERGAQHQPINRTGAFLVRTLTVRQ